MRTLLLLALLGDRPPVRCDDEWEKKGNALICKSLTGRMVRHETIHLLSDGGYLSMPQFTWESDYSEMRLDWMSFRCGAQFFVSPFDGGQHALTVGCIVNIVCGMSSRGTTPRFERRDGGEAWVICDDRDGGR